MTKIEIVDVRDINVYLDSFGYDLQNGDITNCLVSGGTHKAVFLSDCMVTDSEAKDCFFENISLELVSFTNCKYDAVSLHQADLERCVFDSCTFKDCSLGYFVNTETRFINCKFTNCSFTNSDFDVLDESDSKVFNNCSLIKCQLSDCTFKGIKLDGRLCNTKNYMASLNVRFFFSTNIHGTKMYHSEIVVESKKKGKKKMSFVGGDYLHPNMNNRGHVPPADDLYFDPYGGWHNAAYEELVHNQRSVHKSKPVVAPKNQKKAYIFCSSNL